VTVEQGEGDKKVIKITITTKDNTLLEDVETLSEQNLYGCYQCGTCSAGCPFVEDMDITPDEVIRQVILGNEDVLKSKTIWLCAACFACAERCPRDINITRIMEALRQIMLRRNIDNIDPHKIERLEVTVIPQMALVSNFRKNTG